MWQGGLARPGGQCFSLLTLCLSVSYFFRGQGPVLHQCFPAQFPDLLLSDTKRGWLKEHLSARCSPHWHARCGQGPGLGGWRLLGSDCHTSSPQEGATDLPTRDARWGLSHPESGQDVLWAMGRDGPEPGNSGKSGGMLTAGTINPERLSVGVGI